ncbi:MAG: helix-hairpin-helix domain-containing protein [Bacteroidales bacterium]|nr:helix-hairpin-helix domain-containing protein [Bacteroidales bacterium]
MEVFRKFFNAVNNSPFSYVAKKDKRQVITLIVIIFAALFLTKVSQKVAAENAPEIPESELSGFNQRLKDLDVIYREKLRADTLNRLEQYIVSRYDSLKLFKFNPNTVSKEDLARLGFTDKQISNLLNYRHNGGVFKTAEDFRKLYGLRTMQFNFLKDYLVFQDTLKPENETVTAEKPSEKYFDFDPNFITREEMYKMGFSTKQIESFMKLRDEQGKKFYVKKDFSTVFFIDNEKYKQLEKYIKIDLNRLFDGKKLFDLNLATEDELVEAGFSHNEALDVITFREKVGYFYSVWQLSDCIKYERVNVLKDNVYTCMSVEIRKINLNSVSETDLKNHPYFTDFQVKKIMEYRSLGKVFKHIADLQTLSAFSEKDLKKLKNYLTF